MHVLLHLKLSLQFSQIVVLILIDGLHIVICLEFRDDLLLEISEDMVLQGLDVLILDLDVLLSSVQQSHQLRHRHLLVDLGTVLDLLC